MKTIASAIACPDGIKQRVLAALKKRPNATVAELTDLCHTGVSAIKDALEDLQEDGYLVEVKDDTASLSKSLPSNPAPHIIPVAGKTYKFGLVTDTHLCSKYERLDVLHTLYDIFKKEGIDTVYHTGNHIDGEARFNVHDLLVHGFDNQLKYFIDNYPRIDGIKTLFITGDDHEGWYTQKFGIDCGAVTQMRARQAGRKDLIYLGHMEKDVILKRPKGECKIRLVHPGGGSSYAISYTSQKLVESLSSGEKPNVLLIGHYHKSAYNYIRGVHTVQGGCGMDQSPFMRKKRLSAHLGGWIVEMVVDSYGTITRFKPEFFPFYDKDAYTWEYKH